MNDPKYTIRATRTSFEIIELLRDRDGLSITEIADEVGLAKSAVHKHLRTLIELGYLTREGYSYHLGLRCLDLGAAARNRHRLYGLARPEVDRLAQATGERAALFVLEGGNGIYLYARTGTKYEADDDLEGTMADPSESAAGHAIVGTLPKSHDLVRSADLQRELRAVREQGIAFLTNGRDGENSVAAPVHGSDGQPIGAIEVVGPDTRVSGKRLKEDLAGLVLGTATSIETRVGAP